MRSNVYNIFLQLSAIITQALCTWPYYGTGSLIPSTYGTVGYPPLSFGKGRYTPVTYNTYPTGRYAPRTVGEQCPPLESSNVDTFCRYPGEGIARCGKQSMRPGTRAKITCKQFFQYTFATPYPPYSEITCLASGTRRPPPFDCVHECGRPTASGNKQIVNGREAELGIFPWHVGVYYIDWTSGELEHICGGSLISTELVVSAAHCVYDERNRRVHDAQNDAVSAGKFIRSYYEMEDTDRVQKSPVRSIHVPPGYGGDRNMQREDIAILRHHNRLDITNFVRPVCVYTQIKLAMKFKPSDVGNGILMYCSQSNDGLGDFIALIIKDRHVEFRFDSGSGMAVVRSNHVVQPGVWLTLQASRDAREGKLSINDEPQVSGRSPGPVRSMTLNTLLYVGGINRNKITLNKNVGVEKNFRGCINEIDVAGQTVDILRSVVDSSNIKNCIGKYVNQTEPWIPESTPSPTTPQFNPCSGNPCVHGACQAAESGAYACLCEYGYVGRHCENVLKQCELSTPCKHGGTCTDFHGGYKCDCQLGFSGQRCEISVEIVSDVAFHGDGWLELDRSIMTHEDENELLGFEISTNKSSGLIMWHGQTPADLNPDDYISLAVVDGYVEYQYNLGSGPAVIRVTARRIDDGERHRIVLKREGSDGSIELNGEHMESGASDGLQQLLNARGSVYLGGVPDYGMTYGRYSDGFSGCIYTLEVQDSGAITIGDKAIRGKNVYPCTSEIDRPPIRGDGGHVQR